MKVNNAFLVLLVLGIVLVSSCTLYSKPQQTTPTTQPQTQQQSQQAAQQILPEVTKEAEVTKQTTQVKEFKITAKQFSFNPATIEVNKGDKVRLIVTSMDVPHGFSITEYGINERLDPGKPVTIEFTADKQGTFTAFCSVFCGSGHLGVKGKLIVK